MQGYPFYNLDKSVVRHIETFLTRYTVKDLSPAFIEDIRKRINAEEFDELLHSMKFRTCPSTGLLLPLKDVVFTDVLTKGIVMNSSILSEKYDLSILNMALILKGIYTKAFNVLPKQKRNEIFMPEILKYIERMKLILHINFDMNLELKSLIQVNLVRVGSICYDQLPQNVKEYLPSIVSNFTEIEAVQFYECNVPLEGKQGCTNIVYMPSLALEKLLQDLNHIFSSTSTLNIDLQAYATSSSRDEEKSKMIKRYLISHRNEVRQQLRETGADEGKIKLFNPSNIIQLRTTIQDLDKLINSFETN